MIYVIILRAKNPEVGPVLRLPSVRALPITMTGQIMLLRKLSLVARRFCQTVLLAR
jgi:hypothetical protein